MKILFLMQAIAFIHASTANLQPAKPQIWLHNPEESTLLLQDNYSKLSFFDPLNKKFMFK